MEQELGIIKALSDGNRLRVVMALTAHEELCVCQITAMLNLAMATVSRHISLLQKAGLLTSRKEGRWVYYRLAAAFPPLLLQWLKGSLLYADKIAEDKKKLKSITACDLNDLCKAQKQRRKRASN